jgi:hypothetical protein
MRQLFLTAVLVAASAGVSLSGPDQRYTEVRIHLSAWNDARFLAEHGLFLEHFSGNIRTGITLIVNDMELAALQASGVRFDVTVPDVEAAFRLRPPASDVI